MSEDRFPFRFLMSHCDDVLVKFPLVELLKANINLETKYNVVESSFQC